jgi:two-component system chemotaxis response regulator CheB
MTLRPPTEAIVIGGSAGAMEALSEILPALPPGFPIPIAIVLHLPPNRTSLLAQVLGARCAVAVREVEDKEPLAPATIYVGPPNYHLLIERRRTFALSVDAPVHYSRPSIDVLFESAADAYGPRLLGVLLAGANQDGVAGLGRIKAAGGATVVQDPQRATSPEMPGGAIRCGYADRVLAPAEIGRALAAAGRPRAAAEAP